MQDYYMVVNTELKIGQNIYPEKGYYHYAEITAVKNIYTSRGRYLAIINVDSEDQIPMKENQYYSTKGQYKSNKITVKEFHDLLDFETYEKFGLKIIDNEYLPVLASINNHVDVLEKYSKLNQYIFKKWPMDHASKNGHIEVLNWWRNYYLLNRDEWNCDLSYLYSVKSMDVLSDQGNIELLDWWKNSSFKCKYSHSSILSASKNRNLKVLDWWKNSGLVMDIDRHVLEIASKNNHENVLKWWIDYYQQNPKRYDAYDSCYALREATEHGHINVLEIWKNSGLKLYFYSVLDCVSINAIETLNWWKNSGLYLSYSSDIMDRNSQIGRDDILEWVKNSGLKLMYSKFAINWASQNSQFEVLNWWKNSGLELKFDSDAFHNPIVCGKINVLEWWKNSGLNIKLDSDSIFIASIHDNLEMMNWLKDSGIVAEFDPSRKYCDVIGKAIDDKRFDIVKWWINSGLDYEKPKSIKMNFDTFVSLMKNEFY